LSYNFHILNGLKQGVDLLPLLYNFAFEYAMGKVLENQVGLRLKGTHQLLGYTDDVKLVGNNIDNVKKNTETLTSASKEVGLEVNTEKEVYVAVLSLEYSIIVIYR
jgi:hypothetical protein